jgi:hypothetical protein
VRSPRRFCRLLDVVGNGGDVLDGAVVCDDHVFHSVVPETEVDKLVEKPGADDLEFAGENTTSVNVAKER